MGKDNKILNKIAYKNYVNRVEEINKQLILNNEDILCPCASFSDLLIIENEHIFKKYKDEARVILRKEKINKLLNNIR